MATLLPVDPATALGWLIDPYKKPVHVYASDGKVSIVKGKTVMGSGPIEGFTLDLDELWRCYELR